MTNSYLKYIKNIFFNKNELVSLTYFVTNKCNLRCEHCFLWRDLNQTKNELSLDEIDKITKNMGSFLTLFISGGEPFIREDFFEIIKLFYKNCNIKNVNIPTNGTLKDKIIKDVEEILSNFVDLGVNLTISIDNLGEKHDKMRGQKNVFEKALSTYYELKKLKTKYSNLNIEINTTLTKNNQDDIKDLYNFVINELKPDSYAIAPVRGNPKDQNIKDFDIDNYEGIIKNIQKQYKKQSIKGFENFSLSKYVLALRLISPKIITKTIRENKYQTKCYASKLSGVLYSNGDLFPCEMLNKKIGNIRDFDYNIKKMWNSGRNKEIRKFIKETKCFCIHPCNSTINILFNPKYLLKIIWHGTIMNIKNFIK